MASPLLDSGTERHRVLSVAILLQLNSKKVVAVGPLRVQQQQQQNNNNRKVAK